MSRKDLINYPDVIDFMDLWMKYNGKYNELNPTLVNSRGLPLDEKQALALTDDQDAQITYENIKHEFVTSFTRIPSLHCNNGERDRLWKDKPYQKKVLYNEEHCSLKDFLKVVFQLHCNVFYNSKELDEIDIALIIWAKNCLQQLLETLNYFNRQKKDLK